MTRRELIEKIASEHGLSDRAAKLAVTTIFEEMIAALAHGRRVELRGFGSFGFTHYVAHKSRNPSTGEPVDVPARIFPAFRAGLALRQRINQA